MSKFTTLASAALISIFSTVAFSADPPSPPPNYNSGPQSPLVANTDLSDAEKAAYALYEGILQIAEAKIHATSCATAAGSSSVTAFTDGSQFNPTMNFVNVISLGGSFTLEANLRENINSRGQKINIDQSGSGSLAGTSVFGYKGAMTYNAPNNMLYGQASVFVTGINGLPNRYFSNVIKDFNRGSLNSSDNDFFTIFDWGLQSLHKEGFPVNKYWQRSKSRRSDGGVARTVFVKDRLVGSTACRIVIDTGKINGINNASFFFQTGTLVISTVTPGADVPACSEPPFGESSSSPS